MDGMIQLHGTQRSKLVANILTSFKGNDMSEKNIDATQIDLAMVSTYVAERKNAGKTGKPNFCFECIGLKEGCKLYISGEKDAVGEVAKRPTFFKTNRVKLFCDGKEYATLEDAEKAHKTHLGKSAKSATGWKYFKAELSDGKTTARLTLRALWDLWPDLESALSGALASANKPAQTAKPAKSTKKLIDESAALRAQVAELQKQLDALSSKKPTRIIKK